MFDWTTRFGKTLLQGTETVNTMDALKNKKFVALYFSAHFCGPCRKFTPFLSVLYEDQSKPDVEVVFVSQDPTEKEFIEYYETMPWLAIHYNAPEIERLSVDCNVAGIPQVTVFDVETGNLVMEDARSTILAKKSLLFETKLTSGF